MGFDSKKFMEKYMDRFEKEVDSHAIVRRLEMKGVIPPTLRHKIEQNETKAGTLDLYEHIRDNASRDNVLTLCDVMIAAEGYAKMNKLGHDMKSDPDLSLPEGDGNQQPSALVPSNAGATNQTTSNNSAHPHLGLGLIPSDIGLSQVVSKIGIKYEEVAVLLGIPRTHASMQSGSLKGLDTLVYWRNGKSGPNFPTTWKFLLQKVEEVCGEGVAKDIEKALLSNRTWCDGV
jgi:hypothetical protein